MYPTKRTKNSSMRTRGKISLSLFVLGDRHQRQKGTGIKGQSLLKFGSNLGSTFRKPKSLILLVCSNVLASVPVSVPVIKS